MPFCVYCGQPSQQNDHFCMRCGSRLLHESEINSKNIVSPLTGNYQQNHLEDEPSENNRIEKNLNPEKRKRSRKRPAYNMIKGRIAETLIEELFLSMGYRVYRYGMENTIPGISTNLLGVDKLSSNVANNIRKMPDFVVQKDNSVFFIEVKFRKSEQFSIRDVGDDYPYNDVFFIIVSKKHIKCITIQELRENKTISPESNNYLGNRIEFDLDNEEIIKYCNYAVQFFTHVDEEPR
ncbi:MAG: hypothetical protein A4E32_02102 [Methanomassiliicoccales archaeon PtaU1.Bin124]|nr:MAG: hypothetical protein A4E32_02102 [Methanomassiliicoccales archaeon PtaU1.Bin124]